MKNSNKKIEKLEEIFYELTGKGKDYQIFKKLNELVDKVNELADKLESQPEEPKKEQCEHLRGGLPTGKGEAFVCFDCPKIVFYKDMKVKVPYQPEKQIIYTSEGDAVGEVEKKCEKQCEHPIIESEGSIWCKLCEEELYWHGNHFETNEPKKD